MLEPAEVACPHCGELHPLMVDTSEGDADYIEDCHVCCRPLRIIVQCEPGEIAGIEVEAA